MEPPGGRAGRGPRAGWRALRRAVLPGAPLPSAPAKPAPGAPGSSAAALAASEWLGAASGKPRGATALRSRRMGRAAPPKPRAGAGRSPLLSAAHAGRPAGLVASTPPAGPAAFAAGVREPLARPARPSLLSHGEGAEGAGAAAPPPREEAELGLAWRVQPADGVEAALLAGLAEVAALASVPAKSAGAGVALECGAARDRSLLPGVPPCRAGLIPDWRCRGDGWRREVGAQLAGRGASSGPIQRAVVGGALVSGAGNWRLCGNTGAALCAAGRSDALHAASCERWKGFCG